MRQWTVSSLVQVMADRLFSAKPLLGPMMVYSEKDSREQVSVKFELNRNSIIFIQGNAVENFVRQNFVGEGEVRGGVGCEGWVNFP